MSRENADGLPMCCSTGACEKNADAFGAPHVSGAQNCRSWPLNPSGAEYQRSPVQRSCFPRAVVT